MDLIWGFYSHQVNLIKKAAQSIIVSFTVSSMTCVTQCSTIFIEENQRKYELFICIFMHRQNIGINIITFIISDKYQYKSSQNSSHM